MVKDPVKDLQTFDYRIARLEPFLFLLEIPDNTYK